LQRIAGFPRPLQVLAFRGDWLCGSSVTIQADIRSAETSDTGLGEEYSQFEHCGGLSRLWRLACGGATGLGTVSGVLVGIGGDGVLRNLVWWMLLVVGCGSYLLCENLRWGGGGF